MRELAPLLAGLDADQLAAVTSDAAPLAVLANAGSGKTRVLTRRIAWRIRTERADAEHVLAVTFTRKAAGELRTRLRALGVNDQLTAGTFHAIALAQLRRYAVDHNRPPPRILERKARLLIPMLEAAPVGGNSLKLAGAVAGEIEWAKSRGVPVERYEHAAIAAHRRPGLPLERVATLYRQYEQERRRKRLVDFDDLIIGCADLIERDRDFAAAQRWRFRHLHVDEFQDASPAQVRLVKAWLGDRADLFAVGDPDQAIYSFAGADPELLTEFTRSFPGAEVIELRTNYRSTAPVIAAARAVLAPADRVEPQRPEHATSHAPLPTFTEYPDDASECAGIATSIRQLARHGTSWSSIAVLARTNAQAELMGRALEDAAVPNRVRVAAAFLHRPAVKANLDALDEIVRATPNRPFSGHIRDLEDAAANAAPHERGELDALIELAHEYVLADGPAASAAGFRSSLAASLRRDPEPMQRDAVDVITFHRAKGLEWDVVYVIGFEDGLVPISYATSAAALTEERRLAYVALSRARRELHVSWAQTRSFGERAAERDPSPWIEAIVDAVADHVPPVAVVPLERVDALRAALDQPVATDAIAAPLNAAATHEVAHRRRALAEWRARNARALGIVESAILSDTLIAAIAGSAPEATGDLVTAGCSSAFVDRYGAEVLEVLAGTCA
ncbi:MAG: ATP-dependent helicase [Acidimicrobiia bacterium]